MRQVHNPKNVSLTVLEITERHRSERPSAVKDGAHGIRRMVQNRPDQKPVNQYEEERNYGGK